MFLRVWLTCLLLVYPVSWAATAVTCAAPALLRVAFQGHLVADFGFNPFQIYVFTDPPVVPPAPWFSLSLEIAPIVTTAAWLLWRGCSQPLALFAAALLGFAAAEPQAIRIWFRHDAQPSSMAVFALGFAIVCVASWLIASRLHQGGTLRRFGCLAAVLIIPIALMHLAFWILAPHFRGPVAPSPGLHVLISAGLVLAACLAAAALSRMSPEPQPILCSRKPLAMGVASLMVMVFALPPAAVTLRTFRKQARLEQAQAVAASFPPLRQDQPFPTHFFQRGVNFTAEMPNSYASSGAIRMLQTLPSYGVNAIALVPYGGASQQSPQVRRFSGESLESDQGLEQLSRVAHGLGIRVMLKPQLWVRGGWPANLEFPSAPQRKEWFREYQNFLEHYARLAVRIHADLFCIGVELARLSPYEQEWRSIISRVRAIYPGPLVYAAAQGPDFEGVQFWDALDYIGISNYYSLPDDLSTTRMLETIRGVQRRFAKPVIFAEAGFSSYEHPNREPWNESPRTLAPEAQARCYEALFRAFYREPWFQGVYWWKIGTNAMGGLHDGSHTPWGKPAMEVVRRWYTLGER